MIIEKPSDFSTDLFLKAQEKAICHDYSHSMSEPQIAEMRATLASQRASILRLRAYSLKHSNEPALVYAVPRP